MRLRDDSARSPDIGHNGGPPLALEGIHGSAVNVPIGEKFIPLFNHYRHKALWGGRGSGKSHAVGGVITLLSARETKRVVCARQFQNSIRDSSKEVIEIKIRAFGLSDQFGIYEREIVHKKTESRFTFIGLDRNPASAKSLEGADICWIEEARTINQRSMEILIPTIRKPGSELWWTWNPELKNDPVDRYFRGEVPPADSYIQRVGIEDNPWFYHTAMPQEMWHMQQGNPARYRHVWLGEYDEDYEGRIFSNIVIGRIEVPRHIHPRYGMDFGFGPDPSTVVKVYVNDERKEIYVARARFAHVPPQDLPPIIRDVVDTDDDLITADSSQPGTIDLINSWGFNLRAAKKGPGSVKSGITWLQGYRIVIDPELEEMRDEARLYSWQRDKLTGMRMSVPVDAHNHGWDAIRYATEDAQIAPDSIADDGVLKFSLGRRR